MVKGCGREGKENGCMGRKGRERMERERKAKRRGWDGREGKGTDGLTLTLVAKPVSPWSLKLSYNAGCYSKMSCHNSVCVLLRLNLCFLLCDSLLLIVAVE